MPVDYLGVTGDRACTALRRRILPSAGSFRRMVEVRIMDRHGPPGWMKSPAMIAAEAAQDAGSGGWADFTRTAYERG